MDRAPGVDRSHRGLIPVATAVTRHLTVLYDANCPLCVHIRHWLLGQRRLVPLRLIPAASAEARRRYPQLDHASTLKEITVIGDSGQVWTGTDAFIVCLWALAEHRPKANWLATPARPALRQGRHVHRLHLARGRTGRLRRPRRGTGL